jgi:hypothetical protein
VRSFQRPVYDQNFAVFGGLVICSLMVAFAKRGENRQTGAFHTKTGHSPKIAQIGSLAKITEAAL